MEGCEIPKIPLFFIKKMKNFTCPLSLCAFCRHSSIFKVSHFGVLNFCFVSVTSLPLVNPNKMGVKFLKYPYFLVTLIYFLYQEAANQVRSEYSCKSRVDGQKEWL
jgi:hypothetical protein